MKTKLTSLLFVLAFLIIGCGGGPVDSGSWSGSDNIAGVSFSYSLKTNSDNTYTLKGNAGGIDVDEKGTYRKVSDKEIELTSGQFSGSTFKKTSNGMEFYLDNGEFFMTLK